MNSNKADELFGVGTPDSGIMMSGGHIDPIRKKDIMECSEYYPEIDNVDQRDVKTMGYRDTNATISLGSGATYTVTAVSGVITAVAVTGGGSGYAGCPPTVVAVDSGYTGGGAILKATIAGGVVTAVTVVSGGVGYSTSTISIVEFTNKSIGEQSMRPCFKWTEKVTPAYVYKRDTDRFMAQKTNQTQIFNQKVNDLTSRAEKKAISALLQDVAVDVIYGTPATSTDPLWTAPFGFNYALDNTNQAIYAGVDRSVAANYMWRSKLDANARVFTLEQLWKDAHVTKGIGYLGGNVDVFLTNPSYFNKCLSEVQSYQVNPDNDDKIKKLRQFGFEGVIIKHNTSYIMSDIRIKAGTIYGLNAKSWIFATKSGANFAFNKWTDQSTIEGGKVAFYNTCRLQYMLICEAPPLNVMYSSLT